MSPSLGLGVSLYEKKEAQVNKRMMRRGGGGGGRRGTWLNKAVASKHQLSVYIEIVSRSVYL